MNSDTHDYDKAKQLTALSLQHLSDTTELSHLSLPERTALIDEISRILPAGNVPSLVAAGLAHLPDRTVPAADTRRNLNLLIHGMQTFLDKAVYQAFFAGPATVLTAYQMLLRLAGKDIDQSFPEGTWQFYVEFGVREDSGRHTCETTGFQTALANEQFRLTSADELAAWVTTSAWLLDHYPELLASEWLEHTHLRYLAEMIPDETLPARWLKMRPYGVTAESNVDFVQYRRLAFEVFCNAELAKLGGRLRKRIVNGWNTPTAVTQRAKDLAAYQRQMAIQAILTPGDHSDTRTLLSRNQLNLAVISKGRYYLIDIGGPVSVERARPICAAILHDKPDESPATLDVALCTAHRRDQPALRKLLSDDERIELEHLRTVPIILNWDSVPSSQSLAEIRSRRRGLGDHAMTIFRASNSTVFDLSHIFFDGTGGVAVAEIMTNQAIRFARQLSGAPPRPESLPVTCMVLRAPEKLVTQAQKCRIPVETSAETLLARLDLIQQSRRSLQKRNEKLYLTVNDILVLYRSLFGVYYQPSSDLMQKIAVLEVDPNRKIRQAGASARSALESARQANPVLLIPVDASHINPRDRVYPMTFRNPFNLLLDQRRQALAAMAELESAGFLSRPLAYRRFDEFRREYLTTLQAFAQVMRRYKDVSLKGGSVSTATIKLMAGLPSSVQHMLDSLPSHIDLVNDVIKGQEVFSNVGRVADSSTLTRFNTAKDDNEKKVLAWGFITDAHGVLRISLRDARPHVAALTAVRQRALAQQMSQEYVDAYALGLNAFAEELARLARSRRGD